MRVRSSILSFLALAAACSPSEAPTTEILWDKWGVPHVFAADEEDAFFAFGWAQMQVHGDLILRLYGEARGRGAEYWGSDSLDTDRWVRTMGIPERARIWYEAQSPDFRRDLDAFASGMNAYAKAHPDEIADDVEILLPVDGVDILAHAQRAIHFTFITDSSVFGQARGALGAGSNTWAIAPSRSSSGNALLLQNPHLPWSDLFLFTEGHIVAPGVDIYGATLVGSPVLAIAFNDHLGWSHTVNTFDGADLFQVTLVPGGYLWDGETKPLGVEEQTIRVKGASEEKLTLKKTVHGPIVFEDENRAVALRVSGLDAPGMLEEWWDMGQATNLVEFEEALKRLQIPMFNVMYADREGHILYLFGGRVPRRPHGDVRYWEGTVPGEGVATLWTETHPYEDLPRVLDPSSGWLQNANDPPWTSTLPAALHRESFPPYMAPEFMHLRAQHSAKLLLDDDSVEFEELLAYKHSTRMLLAERLVDDLVAAARGGSEIAREAASVLESWDGRADAGSRGAVLFHFWVTRWTKADGGDFAIPWDSEKPTATPDGLADPAKAVSDLEDAAKELVEAYGGIDVAWGDVFRIRYGGKDLPANGAPGEPHGSFRTAYFEREENGRFRIVGGDTYYAVVEFGNPLKARVLTAYGNATQAGSPHRGDQLELFAREEMRPVWRARAEIEANLEKREALSRN